MKDHVIDYSNDVFFKYLLRDVSDDDSLFLLRMFIERTLGIVCKDIFVLNPELIPDKINDKNLILDILVKTDDDRLVDIEMQTSSFSHILSNRLQLYGARMLSSQAKKGELYHQLNPVYQIIFLNDTNKSTHQLIDVYTSKNQTGIEERYNLITRVYVNMSYINHLIKERKELNDIETATYIFKNGIRCDKISVDEKVMMIMKKKHEKFSEDEALSWIAFERQCGEWQHEGEKREAFEDGLVQGHTLGIEEGTVKTLIETLSLYVQTRFNVDIQKDIQLLSSEKLEKLKKNIYTFNTIEEIKEFMRNL